MEDARSVWYGCLVHDGNSVFVIPFLCSQTTSIFNEHVYKEMFDSITKMANLRENEAKQG